MIHRIASLFLGIAVAGCLAMPVSAAEQGSVSVCLNVGDLAVYNGAFSVYRVGVKVSDGYRITEDFGGGFVRQQNALSPHLAQWLSENSGAPERTLLLDADGNAVFSHLGEGLYLVAQTEATDGFYPIQPFLLEMPSGSRWEYPVNLEPLPRIAPSPETGEDGQLYLGLLGMGLSAAGLALCRKKNHRPL